MNELQGEREREAEGELEVESEGARRDDEAVEVVEVAAVVVVVVSTDDLWKKEEKRQNKIEGDARAQLAALGKQAQCAGGRPQTVCTKHGRPASPLASLLSRRLSILPACKLASSPACQRHRWTQTLRDERADRRAGL